ncbi:DNA polymerase III subunit gamma/tau [Gardnerella sp. 2492-Sm]|uniref:DNA polymerase III subunit gamma/tau n=1 Tax=unclassified Gardnerella TaxID=2628112 RepID=UPI003D00835A
MALALYRRYRPDTFDGVIGQDQVTVPLCRALDKGHITHAYLFSGPRGCGKTSSARILARCINCEQGPTSHPCGKCQSCKDLATGGPGSIDVVEIDAASHNGVDDARELRERAGFAPARDRYKIFILDEAHMVTPQGFNALLKIVEEPPEHVMFIFATTEPDKVIGTIRSRTHHYPFRLVPPEVMSPYLEDICKKEGIEPAPGVLRLAMRAGAGSMRDTLSVLDQLMVGAENGVIALDSAVALLGFTPSSLIGEVVDALINADGAAVYDVVRRVIVGGFDTRKFVEDLLGRLRDLLLIVSAGQKASAGFFNDMAPEDLEDLRKQADKLTLVDLSRMAQTVNNAFAGMASAVSPRMNLEILMARLLAERDEKINESSSNTVSSNSTSHNSSVKQTNSSETHEKPAVSHFIGSKSNSDNAKIEQEVSQTSTSTVKKLSVDEKWDLVVKGLPEDVREYVTRNNVPEVSLSSDQNGRQKLVLTFDQPISQHAFALALCATSPYEGKKVPVVVMQAVREIFGADTMIAPAPVAANGERVESVSRMSQEALSKVKREVLLRKTGISTGINLKEKAKTQEKNENLKENNTTTSDSDFLHSDGSAASVVNHQTAESAATNAQISSVDDDAWADMSSVPMSDVMSMPFSEQKAFSSKQEQESVVAKNTVENASSANYHSNIRNFNNDAANSGVNESEVDSSKLQETSSAKTISTGAEEDECSMDDDSLDISANVNVDELKQIFEVKAVEEFAASDPKNPKNMVLAAKKKQEE